MTVLPITGLTLLIRMRVMPIRVLIGMTVVLISGVFESKILTRQDNEMLFRTILCFILHIMMSFPGLKLLLLKIYNIMKINITEIKA